MLPPVSQNRSYIFKGGGRDLAKFSICTRTPFRLPKFGPASSPRHRAFPHRRRHSSGPPALLLPAARPPRHRAPPLCSPCSRATRCRTDLATAGPPPRAAILRTRPSRRPRSHGPSTPRCRCTIAPICFARRPPPPHRVHRHLAGSRAPPRPCTQASPSLDSGHPLLPPPPPFHGARAPARFFFIFFSQ
jgi:hypothetical protein